MKREIIDALKNGKFYGFVYDRWQNFSEEEKLEMILNLYYEIEDNKSAIKRVVEDLEERL